MRAIMENDDAVESLTNIEVMDVYVRYTIADAMMKFYGKRRNGFDNDLFQETVSALEEKSMEGVRVASIKPARRGILHGWIARVAAENRAEDFIVEVFDRMTNDDYTRDERVDMARKKLKKILKGSMGMPNDSVVRERLDRLTEE